MTVAGVLLGLILGACFWPVRFWFDAKFVEPRRIEEWHAFWERKENRDPSLASYLTEAEQTAIMDSPS